MIQSENNNILLQNVIRMDSLHKNIIHMLLLKEPLNGEIGICTFSSMSPESFSGSPDQGVKMTNHQFGQDHTKPNFRLQLVLQKSPKENAKSIFSDVLNNRVLQSTSFSQSVITSIPFYA